MRLERIEVTKPARAAEPLRDAVAKHARLQRRDATALREVLHIADVVGLDAAQTALILGTPSRTLQRWKQQAEHDRVVGPLPADTVERMSYILGIWKALVILLPDLDARLAWLRNENTSPVFGGRPPIERVLGGQVGDLYVVRTYLDGWRG